MNFITRHHGITLRGEQVASSSSIIPDGTHKVAITLRPSMAKHETDLGEIVWATGMVSLTVSREVRNGIRPGGLLNGLDVPVAVKTLCLNDTVKDAPPSSNVRMGSGLDYFYATGVDSDTVELVCRASTRLWYMVLTACPVRVGSLSLPKLRSINLTKCGLEVIPPNLDQIAPMLHALSLRGNKIGSLGGVVFPPGLVDIDLCGNHGIDVSDAKFPAGLERLVLRDCYPITGLDVVPIPLGVRNLSITGNKLKTIDGIGLPPALYFLFVLPGNRIKDRSALIRHSMRYQKMQYGPYWGDEQLRKLMPRYFENQDRVKVLVSARRIHRIGGRSAVRKLPGDLLRVALGFLAETPQLQ